jgi:murein DD-endopeptidase MepM/ murein hydrolase activator NlpD
MPAWLARFLLLLAQGLLPHRGEGEDRGPWAFLGLVLAVVFGPVLVLMSFPLLLSFAPAVPDDRLEIFAQAAQEVRAATGVDVAWEEVVAAWAAAHDQDFSQAAPERVKAFAWNWVKEHRTTKPDGTEEVTYTRRSFDEVLDILGLSADQKEAAQRYLATLRELLSNQPGASGVEVAPEGGPLTWPLPGYTRVSSGYGLRIHPVTLMPQFHRAIDIPAPQGTPVVAAHSGTVVEAGYSLGLGNYVVLEGGGYWTSYGHLSAILVSEGQQVQAGQVIGLVGSTGLSTGPHLDFRVRYMGQWQNPLTFFGR